MKIETQYYYFECGDGCCSYYGYDLFVNDEKVDKDFSEREDALRYVLEELLGVKVDTLPDDVIFHEPWPEDDE